MEVIEAEILPYILRYVGITTLLDPALSAAVAALGLYLREGNPLEDLHHLGNEGRCSNSRQRAVVQNLINMWHPYVHFEEIFGALTTRANTPAQIIANLKKVVISGMVREAKSRLAIKIDREGWKGGIDHIWVDLVAGAPKRQCGGIARYTLLRWAVNQDDDVWLSMRGTRHQQKMRALWPSELCLPLWAPVSSNVWELHSGETIDSMVHCTVESPFAPGIHKWSPSWPG